MNTPITGRFFRKIELFQDVIDLNKIFRRNVWELKNGSKNTWEIEKKVLYWARFKHKHLGSTLTGEKFNSSVDLSDFVLTNKGVSDELGGGQYWLMNLVQHNYADRHDSGEGVLINSNGLLMAALLSEIYKLKKIQDQKIFHKHFWVTYKTKYEATHFLAKRSRYWVYWIWTKLGWLLFASAAFIVLEKGYDLLPESLRVLTK